MKTLYPILLPCFLLSGIIIARGEGTKEVMPDSTNGTGLIVSTSSSFPLGNVGSYLGAPADQRVYFRINNYTTETLYYGFNWETLSPATPIAGYNDVYMNIYDPTGVLVKTVHMPTSGPGFISNYSSVGLNGAQIGGSPAAGYVPLTFKPTQNGDYYVSFYRSTDSVDHNIAESMLAKYFDMTVAATVGAVTTRYTGRVHCNEWALSVYNPASNDIQDPLSSTNAQFFTYTPDSVVVKVYFPKPGFQPLSYIVAFNSFGVINHGNWLNDRKSIVLEHLVTPYLQGGYDVFLNRPDSALYPVCVIPNPPVLVSPTISGCPPGPFNVRFKAPQAGDYYMLFDLNGIPGYQPNSADLYVELINQSPGIINYIWNGKDGLGNQVPANTKFPITFSYRKGRINIPFYDVELNINGFSVDAVAPKAVFNTTLYWDDTQIVDSGTDCSNNNNNYTGVGYANTILGQVSPGHAWNGNGNPTFAEPAPAVKYGGIRNDSDNVQCNDFGNARLINTWAWGITLDVTDTLTLACVNVKGTVWDDADGSAAGGFTNIQTNSEQGTNAGNTLYASLVDPLSGRILSTASVSSNGTYLLPNCPFNATGMKVVISTTPGMLDSIAPAGAIPSTWLNTSPLVHPFNSGVVDVTGIDFGIERLPNSDTQRYTIAMPVLYSFLTLNGFSTIASPGPLSGSDPEDGTMGSGKNVAITQVPSNEQLYYNGVLVTNNTVITNYDPTKLQVKFTNIMVDSTQFQYAYIDAAGKQDPTPATYTIQMSTVLATSIASFTARATDEGDVLSWITTNETSGTYFVIERSSDGKSFTPIGQINADGQGQGNAYSFTDKQPLVGGTNYYRLQLSDNSGASWFSNVVLIGNASASTVISVSPNPFREGLTIRLDLATAEKVRLRMLDGKGQLLRQISWSGNKGENDIPLDGLGSLPVSIYFIQIVLPDQVFVRKVFN